MRHVAMQLLTWGTVVGALGSALLLAGLYGDPSSEGKTLSLADAGTWRAEPVDPDPLRSVGPGLSATSATQSASQPTRR